LLATAVQKVVLVEPLLATAAELVALDDLFLIQRVVLQEWV
jgi:hypothetical protein